MIKKGLAWLKRNLAFVLAPMFVIGAGIKGYGIYAHGNAMLAELFFGAIVITWVVVVVAEIRDRRKK